jgi:hypothetical protein
MLRHLRTFSSYIRKEKDRTEPSDFVLQCFSGTASFVVGLWWIICPMPCGILLPKRPCACDELNRGAARLCRRQHSSELEIICFGQTII